MLWDLILNYVAALNNSLICVVGDFNAIRSVNERSGRRSTVDYGDIDAFNEFIDQANLFEIPISGRFFTWYRKDRSCKSKLDRMLVNDDWLNRWNNFCLKGGTRTFSDHCPIYVVKEVKDWGPRPFKFINSWTLHPDFSKFVKNKWKGHKVSGWAGYRLKEKLKLLKLDFKEWNKEIFWNLDDQIEQRKRGIEELDCIDDALGLDEEEVVKRNKLTAELMRASIWRDKLLSQKAKLKWVTEGDVNSKFFHNWINRKAKRTEMDGIWVNNLWINSVKEVKEEVESHFRKQFKTRNISRPQLSCDIFCNKISNFKNEFLEAKFTEEEIKGVVWGCDSNKSPGPDGYSFAFIKANWKNMKRRYSR